VFIFRNRFADRDMGMRYYWGEGVGHVYAHTWDERDLGSSDSLDASAADPEDEDPTESAGEPNHLPVGELPMDDDSLGHEVSDGKDVVGSDDEEAEQDEDDDDPLESEEEIDYYEDD
jgi:hypothetical protein